MECQNCGCPYEDEIVHEEILDEDMNLIEPAEVVWLPQCDCAHLTKAEYAEFIEARNGTH